MNKIYDEQRAAGCPRCFHPWDAHTEDEEELILRNEDGCALSGTCQLCETIDNEGQNMTTDTPTARTYNAEQVAEIAGLDGKAFRDFLRENLVQADRATWEYEFTAEEALDMIALFRYAKVDA